MKKTTSSLKLLATLALFLCAGFANAQCALNISWQPGLNGDINLTAISTPSTVTYTAVNWDFGNGVTVNTSAPNTSMSISQTYTADGMYTVSVTALGSCSTSITQTIYVNNANCNLTPLFSVTTGTAMGAAFYTNNSTGTTSATTYSIGWGDGSYNGSLPHNYAANGVYTITLYAYANTTPNCISMGTQTVSITNACAIPSASFSYSAGTNGDILFTSTTAGTGTNTLYQWQFSPLSSYSVVGVDTASHVYPSNGAYNVTLIITDSQCSVSVTQSINVTTVLAPCQLSAAFNTSDLGFGQTSFNNLSTGTTTNTTYSWDFGDSSAPSTSVSPIHTYSANGIYTVILTASNNSTASCISSDTAYVNVTSYRSLGLPAVFVYPGANGSASVLCVINGTNSNTVYYWDFGNGTSVGPLTAPTATTTYTANGSYVVNVMIDNVGPSTCTVASSYSITITNTFNAMPCNLQVGMGSTGTGSLVAFNNATYGNDSTTTYLWDFGDGTTSTAMFPTHGYTNNGNYIVTLTAYNDSLCVATGTMSEPFYHYSCTADATFSIFPTGTPHDWYVVPADTNIANAEWSWGDGTTSNTLFTSHTYSAAGLYTICLTATTSCGSVDMYCFSYYVSKGTDVNQIVQVNVVTLQEIITGIRNNSTESKTYYLYPNPASGLFNLSMNGIKSSNATISVYNIIGKLVYENAVDISNGNMSKEINLDTMTNGVYFVKVSADNTTYTKKLIINK